MAAVLRPLRTLWPWRLAAIVSLTGGGICPVHTDLLLVPRVHPPCSSTLPVRSLQLCSTLRAGHNKWSKVKNIKGPKDDERGRMFMKFAMMIRVAVREGGPNPEFNVPLANILEQCRSKNMPKASVETAIKGVEKTKPGSECTYEARGPGGCMMLIEILTDNKTRSHQEIKHVLRKNGGLLADVRHNFSRKGVVVVAQGITTERALELAIEAGAEDVQEIEDEEEKPVLQFICDATELKKVRDSLGDLGTQVVSAGLAFVPQTPTPLDQVQLEAASVLIDALLDRSDVIRVWDDIRAQS